MVRDENYWRGLHPYIFDERRWGAAESDVDAVLKVSGVTSGTVLDLCCGPGRQRVPLAQTGFAVTADP